jgi:aspartate/methionine/tyrosine aminotransferase
MTGAHRLQQIQPFHVMALLARARQMEAEGRDIVHMEVGEPDFPTPPAVIQAAESALKTQPIHYTPALGLPDLRQAIADYYAERYGVELDWRRVVVTPGSSAALQLAMAALLNPGDEILLPDPGYPCNRNFAYLVNAKPRSVPVHRSGGFRPTAKQIANAWSPATRALMVASPSNPTGTCLSLGELAELAEAISPRQGYLIVDEIYQGLTYGNVDETALSLAFDRLIVVNSFSKYFGMTGWRLGWLVVPDALVEPMDRLAQNLYLCAPTLAQHAALAALNPANRPELDRRRDEFHQRRDFLYTALKSLGFVLGPSPQGAFYLYADCSALTHDSQAFCEQLLEQVGVAVTPGLDFGSNAPQAHVRFAFTTGLDRLQLGVDKIAEFLA